MAAERKSTGIAIGDRVCLREHFRFTVIMDHSVEIELVNTKKKIVITKYLSSLGSMLPKFSWVVPRHPASLTEHFYCTGIYTIGEIEYQADLNSEEDDLENLKEIVNEINSTKDGGHGSLVMGVVIAIYAKYSSSPNSGDEIDIEFFEDTTEAEHDFYADDVIVVIKDLGTYIEYPINLKHLTKM